MGLWFLKTGAGEVSPSRQTLAKWGVSDVISACRLQLTKGLLRMQYVLFFPPAEKYVSVIKDPGELEGEARQKLESERRRLRGLAFARRAEQAMVNEADEGAGLLGPQQDLLQQEAPQVTHYSCKPPPYLMHWC